MAFEKGNLDATFAAAAGEDPALMAELRVVFAESVARQLDMLQRSRCDANWEFAAQRLKGLAASFHADALIELAQEAVDAAPGEPTVIRRIAAFHRELVDAGN